MRRRAAIWARLLWLAPMASLAACGDGGEQRAPEPQVDENAAHIPAEPVQPVENIVNAASETACPAFRQTGSGAPRPVRAGVYSDIWYSTASGDEGGQEIRISNDRNSPQIDVIVCEGVCLSPVKATDVSVHDDGLSYIVGRYERTFITQTKNGIGLVDKSDCRITHELPRKPAARDPEPAGNAAE